MSPNVFLEESNNNTALNNTVHGFCSGGGGIWPAVQALIAFLTTNIIAHAATIYLPPGSDTSLSVFTVFQALLLPVNAGDYAFHAIGRWIRRFKKGQIKGLSSAFGGFKFEDAATAGAIAISVPLKFVPLLHGRWDAISSQQKLVMLDNEKFSHHENWGFRGSPGGLPFKISDKFFRYVPYILPSTTEFLPPTAEVAGYSNYRISPQSNMLPKIIAIIQLVLSGRSLYLKYHTSILTIGLSSPFLVVVPYLLMTLVNLLANTLVGSYTQIIVLPMAEDQLPKPNQVYIGCWPNEDSERVIALVPKEISSDTHENDVAEAAPAAHSSSTSLLTNRTDSTNNPENNVAVVATVEQGSSSAHLPANPTKATSTVNVTQPRRRGVGAPVATPTVTVSSEVTEPVVGEKVDQTDVLKLVGAIERRAYEGSHLTTHFS